MNNYEFPTDGWRDLAADPALSSKVLLNLDRREKTRHRRVLAFGFLSTGVGAAGLSTFFLFGTPTTTLAQVLEAGSKVTSFTETNRRIMGPEKGDGFSTITRVSGDVFLREHKNAHPSSSDGTFGYSDSHQRIHYYGQFKLALIDGPGQMREAFDRIPKITWFLKDFKASKVENNYIWNGRKVTRFTFKNKNHDYDIDEELLADPQTNLPLKFISMRDKRSWGDEWLFDYSPIDKKTLKPTIPAGAKIVDLRPQREKLVATLSHSKVDVPTWLSSSMFESVLIVKKSAALQNQFMQFEADVTSELLKKTIHFRGIVEPNYHPAIKVNGQDYWQFNLVREGDRLKNTFVPTDRLSGSITFSSYQFPPIIEGRKKTFTFKNIAATEVGYAHYVVAPFMLTDVRPMLGGQTEKKK